MGSIDRREYLTATTIDQDFLDRCQDALENKLELIVEIDSPDGKIYASDRNKYVGSRFYECLTEFPEIKRSLGNWLSPVVEFSTLTISLSNVDGRFNKYLPGGSNFHGWIGRTIVIKIGLRDVEATYIPVFVGTITDVGGFSRDRQKITFIARDNFDIVDIKFPNLSLTKSSFPYLEDRNIGLVVPYILGDWTVELSTPFASIPCYVLNGANEYVLSGDDKLNLIISVNPNREFDINNFYLKKGDEFYKIHPNDITINGDNNTVLLAQAGCGGITEIEGEKYVYKSGDQFYCRVKGKAIDGGYNDNIIWQARDILLTYGGINASQLDPNWATYRDKSSPAQSAIASFKSRVWVQEPQSVIQYAVSLLAQVRLEMFVSRDQKFKINSMHFEDWQANPWFKIRNWDIETGRLEPRLDEANVWNRARGVYSYDPMINDSSKSTPTYRNQAAITQATKDIPKNVVFPNLYKENDVILNLKEMIKLASAYSEQLDVVLTSRSFLKDLGDFVLLNVEMGSIELRDVPCMFREIGYDPRGLKLPAKLWSFQLVPFPGWTPEYSGIVGGYNATITEE